MIDWILGSKHTMGNETTLSERKLSSKPGSKAPPPEINSIVVSISADRLAGPSTQLMIFSLFLMNTLACAARCLSRADGSLMVVSVGT